MGRRGHFIPQAEFSGWNTKLPRDKLPKGKKDLEPCFFLINIEDWHE